MSKIVIIGAGKTGRGYLARLLKESEKEICFVDKNETLVKELQEKRNLRSISLEENEKILLSKSTAAVHGKRQSLEMCH